MSWPSEWGSESDAVIYDLCDVLHHDADFLGFYEILYNIYTRSVTPDRAVEIASANLGITKEEATKSIESIMENSKDFYIPNFGGVYIE